MRAPVGHKANSPSLPTGAQLFNAVSPQPRHLEATALDNSGTSDQTEGTGRRKFGETRSTDQGVREMTEQPIGDEDEEVEEETAAEPEHVASAHDEALVEEWEDESFPASDPPSNY